MAGQAPRVDDADAQRLHTYLRANAAGRERAVPARRIVQDLGLGANGDRWLRAVAHRATELGLLLCADNAGYFVPNTPAEVEEMVGRLRSQAAEMNERARQIENLASRHFYSTQLPLI